MYHRDVSIMARHWYNFFTSFFTSNYILSFIRSYNLPTGFRSNKLYSKLDLIKHTILQTLRKLKPKLRLFVVLATTQQFFCVGLQNVALHYLIYIRVNLHFYGEKLKNTLLLAKKCFLPIWLNKFQLQIPGSTKFALSYLMRRIV